MAVNGEKRAPHTAEGSEVVYTAAHPKETRLLWLPPLKILPLAHSAQHAFNLAFKAVTLLAVLINLSNYNSHNAISPAWDLSALAPSTLGTLENTFPDLQSSPTRYSLQQQFSALTSVHAVNVWFSKFLFIYGGEAKAMAQWVKITGQFCAVFILLPLWVSRIKLHQACVASDLPGQT